MPVHEKFDRYVNTDSSWVTQNFFHGGSITVLRLENGKIDLCIDGKPIVTIDPPVGVTSIGKACIDNDRIFILGTPEGETDPAMYWCCISDDKAKWVEYVFAVAEAIATKRKPDAADSPAAMAQTAPLLDFLLAHIPQLRGILLQGLDKIKPVVDLGLSAAGIAPIIQATFDNIEKLAPTDPQRRVLLGDMLNTLFTGFMRGSQPGTNGLDIEGTQYEFFDEWAQGYRQWVDESHMPLVWNRIWRTTVLVTNPAVFKNTERKHTTKVEDSYSFQFKGSDILDIAVGNWHQTVATHYLLLNLTPEQYRNIFGTTPGDDCVVLVYLDEEPIMTAWQLVPGGRRLPYPFSKNVRISASNSVVSCLVPGKKGTTLYWMRFDYHNYLTFKWFPLNWTEWYFGSSFDVDELQLSFRPSQSRKLRATVLGILGDLVRALVDPQFRTTTFKKTMVRFAEKRNHHPGWHSLQMPIGSTTEFSLRTSSDTPWPVPGVNIFMKYLLLLSRALKTAPSDTAQLVSWVDTVLDLLDILYVNAKNITDTYNAHATIRQGLGIFGENPLVPSYNYPVWLVCRMQDSSLSAMFAPWSTVAKYERFKPFSPTKPFTLSIENQAVTCNSGNLLCTQTAINEPPFIIHYLRQQTIALQASSGLFVKKDAEGNLRTLGCSLDEATVFTLEPREVKLKSHKGPYIAQGRFLFIKWLRATARTSASASIFSVSNPDPDRYRLQLPNGNGLSGINLSAGLDKNTFSLRSFGNHVYSFLTGHGRCLQLQPPFGLVGIGETDLSVNTLFKMVVVSAALRTADQSGVRVKNNGELYAAPDSDCEPSVLRFTAA